MNAHIELFGKVLVQPIVLGMFALIAFATAFRGSFRVGISVSLVWLAAVAMIFGILRAMHNFNPLSRDILAVSAALLLVVFSVCAAVWIRDRNTESKPSTALSSCPIAMENDLNNLQSAIKG
jgi:hypothetical protein